MVTPTSDALSGHGKSALTTRQFEVSKTQITLTPYRHFRHGSQRKETRGPVIRIIQ